MERPAVRPVKVIGRGDIVSYSLTKSFRSASHFWAALGAMEIPTDLPGILSSFGLPAGAVALGYGLVKGADALEADASADALKSISGLLKRGPLTGFGALGATVVPLIFDKVFGQRPLSFKFIYRSVLISILFWVILIFLKHPNWGEIISSGLRYGEFIWISLPVALMLDWLSLTKARIILNHMITSGKLARTLSFVAADLVATYLLMLLLWLPITLFTDRNHYPFDNFFMFPLAAIDFYSEHKNILYLPSVFVPSTMLTSIWVILFLLSSVILGLLAPLEYLRRFTLWWFDIDKHPLKAIAKVAATLIVVGAFALKAVRWGWMVV
jgi:hypothetical protein